MIGTHIICFHTLHSPIFSRIKAGEMQRLRDLKRKARQEQRKVKVLKADQHFDTIADLSERNDGKVLNKIFILSTNLDDDTKTHASTSDVHSLEFDMRHKDNELIEMCHAHKLSHSRATILKYALCSGLYPMYGILDEYNQYKVYISLVCTQINE
jgi:hypothetical protein